LFYRHFVSDFGPKAFGVGFVGEDLPRSGDGLCQIFGRDLFERQNAMGNKRYTE
jgi:hypothetical protein